MEEEFEKLDMNSEGLSSFHNLSCNSSEFNEDPIVEDIIEDYTKAFKEKMLIDPSDQVKEIIDILRAKGKFPIF